MARSRAARHACRPPTDVAASGCGRAGGSTLSAAKKSRLTAGTKNSGSSHNESPASRSRRLVTTIPIHTNGSATASMIR